MPDLYPTACGARTLFVLAALAAISCGRETEPSTAPELPAEHSAQTAVTAGWYQISAGGSLTCGVALSGAGYCMGWNFFGTLGDGTTTDRSTPTRVVGGLTFRQVSAGSLHSCGVSTGHRAYCWGANSAGELGDGTTQSHPSPAQVRGSHLFRQVDVGSNYTCGVTYPDNLAYCWGYNGFGNLGDGSATTRLLPVAVYGGRQFREVRAGADHTCGVTAAGKAYCWGSNAYGQVGDSSTALRRNKPSLVAGGHLFRGVDAGYWHSCGVTTDGRAFCWGQGAYGQLGDGKTIRRYTPRRVLTSLLFDRLTTGDFQTCGETDGNRAYCWGDNSQGQLGDGTTTQRLTPVAVSGGLFFTQVSSGTNYTCGVASGATAYCWGLNQNGRFGNGATTGSSLKPTAVLAPN